MSTTNAKAIYQPHGAVPCLCSCPACCAQRQCGGQTHIDDYNEWAATKTLPPLFAMILTGTALAPHFHHGDTLAVNACCQPQTGDAVLVVIGSSQRGRSDDATSINQTAPQVTTSLQAHDLSHIP